VITFLPLMVGLTSAAVDNVVYALYFYSCFIAA